jgi:hypothetical protein
LINPAPNIRRNSVHRQIQMSHMFGAMRLAPAKMVKKPTSHNRVSHPKL